MNDNRKYLLKAFSIVSMFIYEVLVAIAIGYAIGYGLDKLFNTELVFKAIFMLVGMFAGLRNLIVKALKLGEELDE